MGFMGLCVFVVGLCGCLWLLWGLVVLCGFIGLIVIVGFCWPMLVFVGCCGFVGFILFGGFSRFRWVYGYVCLCAFVGLDCFC